MIIDSLESLLNQLRLDFKGLYWYFDKQYCYYTNTSSKVIRLDIGLRMNLYIEFVDEGNDVLSFMHFKLYRSHDLIECKFSKYDSLFVEIANTLMQYGYKTGFHRDQIMMDLYDAQNMEGR